MLTNELVKEVPSVRLSDTVAVAKESMQEMCICDLPVLNGDKLAGVLPGDILQATPDNSQKIDSLREDFFNIFVNKDQHILDVLFVAGLQESSIVPVIDNSGIYQGSIRLQDLVRELSLNYTFTRPGGILTIDMDTRDFQLSEIARIIESNDAKILSMLSSFNTDGSKVYITLKLNQQDLKHITATFERYGYQVRLYHEDQFKFNDLKDRYDYLMRFIDI